jgi:regulatory protein
MLKHKRTAYEAGVDLLSRREHAEQELFRKLLQKGFLKDQIQEALARLKEGGYLSDARYAEARIRYLIRRGYGPDYIRQDLAQYQIQVSAEDVSVEYTDLGVDLKEQAIVLLDKKTSSIPLEQLMERADRSRVQKRLTSYLVRRGISFGLANSLINDYLKERLNRDPHHCVEKESDDCD